MCYPSVLLLLCMLHITKTVLLRVLPSSEVWEGDMVTMECGGEGEEGVIWTRERVGEEELIAHHGIILINDARIQVGEEERNNVTISSLKASARNQSIK